MTAQIRLIGFCQNFYENFDQMFHQIKSLHVNKALTSDVEILLRVE